MGKGELVALPALSLEEKYQVALQARAVLSPVMNTAGDLTKMPSPALGNQVLAPPLDKSEQTNIKNQCLNISGLICCSLGLAFPRQSK